MHLLTSLLTQMVHANRHITLATAFDQAEHVIIHSRRIKHMLLRPTKHMVLYTCFQKAVAVEATASGNPVQCGSPPWFTFNILIMALSVSSQIFSSPSEGISDLHSISKPRKGQESSPSLLSTRPNMSNSGIFSPPFLQRNQQYTILLMT